MTNCSKVTTNILAMVTVVIITLLMLDISIEKEIKAQPIFSGSQPIIKTPASHIHQSLQQKSSSSFCKPNDTFVNTTESKICGLPATIKPNNATSISPGPTSP